MQMLRVSDSMVHGDGDVISLFNSDWLFFLLICDAFSIITKRLLSDQTRLDIGQTDI
jgi:hypothetical protein